MMIVVSVLVSPEVWHDRNLTSIDNWVNFRRLLSGSQSLDEKVIWEIFRNMARTAHKLVSSIILLV